MKLNEIAASKQDCYLIYPGNNEEVYVAVSKIFSLFGYKDIATLDEFKLADDELEDVYMGAKDIADRVGIWAKGQVSKDQVLKSVESNGLISFSD